MLVTRIDPTPKLILVCNHDIKKLGVYDRQRVPDLAFNKVAISGTEKKKTCQIFVMHCAGQCSSRSTALEKAGGKYWKPRGLLTVHFGVNTLPSHVKGVLT